MNSPMKKTSMKNKSMKKIQVLSVAIALAHKGVVLRMRQALPYVHLASAALLLVMGAYLAYYGWYEIRVHCGNLGRDPIVDFFQRRQSALSAWINLPSPMLDKPMKAFRLMLG